MENFVWNEFHELQRTAKNFRIGFVDADFAGNENMREQLRNAEAFQNDSEAAVKIRNDRELESRPQFLQNIDHFRIQLPHAGLGEMFVGDLEKVIAIELAQIRRDFVDHKIDKAAPPIFVIVFARSIDWLPPRHCMPGAVECAIELPRIEFQSDFLANERVMVTDSARQMKECPGRIEKDRF